MATLVPVFVRTLEENMPPSKIFNWNKIDGRGYLLTQGGIANIQRLIARILYYAFEGMGGKMVARAAWKLES